LTWSHQRDRVHETELGDTFLLRLATPARLRVVLDQAGFAAAIHLFGPWTPCSPRSTSPPGPRSSTALDLGAWHFSKQAHGALSV